jgi:hypothetical protein
MSRRIVGLVVDQVGNAAEAAETAWRAWAGVAEEDVQQGVFV